MRDRWVVLRVGFDSSIAFHRFTKALGCERDEGVAILYRLAGWFEIHGDYGKVETPPSTVDMVMQRRGVADALLGVGWMVDHDGVLTLREFCSVSAKRKSLGVKVRRDVLRSGRCAACGSKNDLVVDHIRPIVRGGSCDRSNLQALCRPCNSAKGRKTMDEFMSARGVR